MSFDPKQDCAHPCPFCQTLSTHLPACEDKTCECLCPQCERQPALTKLFRLLNQADAA